MSDATDKQGFFSRLRAGINRGDSFLTYDLATFLPGRTLDEDALDELETRLLTADVGVENTTELMDAVYLAWRKGDIKTVDDLRKFLSTQLRAILQPSHAPLELPEYTRPFIILMVGINGAGKTTTAGKMAAQFSAQGKRVLLAAGDTFRAAAVQQLVQWGERLNVPVIRQDTGADSASVIFDAMQAARARDVDVLIADTAGRLHTQGHLMDELKKIKRVMQKVDGFAPHEVMLVLDAGIGGNALAQARQFHEAVGLTGISVTKLDGTAKGGIVFALAKAMSLPIRYVGVGESVEDLGVFDPREFVDALLSPTAQLTH